ncbi:MAG: hypothetical protein MGF17_11570 [Trichodesmium sp. MAG_R04]|nr:hypothetical protein [Trichodesmium sp. MAG_R04]
MKQSQEKKDFSGVGNPPLTSPRMRSRDVLLRDMKRIFVMQRPYRRTGNW